MIHPQQRPAEARFLKSLEAGEPSIFYDVHKYRGTSAPELDPPVKEQLATCLAAIERSSDLALVETMNHKRRWQLVPWREQVRQAKIAEMAKAARAKYPLIPTGWSPSPVAGSQSRPWPKTRAWNCWMISSMSRLFATRLTTSEAAMGMPRMQALPPIELVILQRINQIESGNPKHHGRAQEDRRQGELAAYG